MEVSYILPQGRGVIMFEMIRGAETFTSSSVFQFSNGATSESAPESGQADNPQPSTTDDALSRIREAIGDDVRIVTDAPPEEGDERQPGIDRNGLYTLMQRMRQPFTEAMQRSTQSLMESMMEQVSFSFENAFSNMLTKNQANGMQGLMTTLQKRFDKLAETDPEQAQRLKMLLDALSILNPENGKRAMESINRALENLDTFYKIAQNPPTPQAPPTDAASTQQSPTTRIEMIHFELDLEITSTQSVESVVAQLNDEGIKVETTSAYASQTIKLHVEFTGIRMEQSDPLVLDLDGDGVNLSSAWDGENFDITGTGKDSKTAFVRGDDAFLALDRNGNGRIDSGKELFGDQHGAKNGFAELTKYDSDGNNRIDAADSIYESLRLLHDKNGDGKVKKNEMSTLGEMGIDSIDLNFLSDTEKTDQYGNRLAESSAFTRSDGSKGQIVDAWLGYYNR